MSTASAMGTISITPLRNCFEGAVPSVLATCSPEGVPNVTYLSQVQYVDARHVALTFQFFNKTRRNILANPWAVLKVVDPYTGHSYRLQVRYLRTETSGALFESMKAKLAGIASHTGMAEVFKLLGADVYEVLQVDPVPSPAPAPALATPDQLPRLRQLAAALNASRDLDELLDNTLTALQGICGIEHQMILKLDECGDRLFTVASRGYEQSGVGSEIPMGHGVIGVAARERTPIRISHMTSEYIYGKAVRDSAAALGLHHQLETAIPMPGLAECRSQMAVPILAGQSLYGVLYVESPEDLRFSYDDEDTLQILAHQFGWMARSLATEAACEPGAEAPPPPAAPARAMAPTLEAASAAEAAGARATQGKPLQVRYFRADHSVFLDDDYLIKGLAGAILWKLLQALQREGRDQFSNRELRLDPELALPDIADNLEARLVLLQRRLAERSACVHMRKTGRGRFALEVSRPLRLVLIE
ncbi:GAF domain-containing protein [Azohydromonas caseinilytica]|uniref:GAF domain-containing protein n=1 Tax=Azohydromonas caseinilytica TaxID=2728836 RepID=A0A848FHT7_9BURK|nr:GAF domain-containing protein [Azohydromonas caseinilytica]NML18874.1 GAF domain-containing protein [Azohydromonas caseinilytica]